MSQKFVTKIRHKNSLQKFVKFCHKNIGIKQKYFLNRDRLHFYHPAKSVEKFIFSQILLGYKNTTSLFLKYFYSNETDRLRLLFTFFCAFGFKHFFSRNCWKLVETSNFKLSKDDHKIEGRTSRGWMIKIHAHNIKKIYKLTISQFSNQFTW